MAKVITFSRVFPKGHARQGQPTFFVEKIHGSLDEKDDTKQFVEGGLYDIFNFDMYRSCDPKHHTIRGGNRWKVGDKFSPRIWTSKPYRSKMMVISDDIDIKQVYDIDIYPTNEVFINGEFFCSFGSEKWDLLCKNDGLSSEDMRSWFCNLPFSGQIICWNENVNYIK